jgi:3-oxoacyl-[acyl-carrier-protein] synthase-3
MSKLVGIIGTGSYVPEKILTNFDLEKIVETTDEWIRTRSGIRERRIAKENEATSDLGLEAAKKALIDAKIKPEDISLIIVTTATPDYQFPSTACILQHKLGAKNAAAFDLAAACSGFIYGIETARQFVHSGAHKYVLVVGAEKMSSVIDWTDRNICVLLGDGAGACVIGEVEKGKGIVESYLAADGAYSHLITLPAGGAAMPATIDTVHSHLHFMKMEGREVFKQAVIIMASACMDVLKKCNLTIEDIDWIIPHQANIRIITAAAERVKIPISKVYTNLERYGNMSSASIPVALDEAIKDGSVKKGQRILLIAFGSGITWAASIIEL